MLLCVLGVVLYGSYNQALLVLSLPVGFGRERTRQMLVVATWPISDKGLYSESYGFSSSHVRIWELDHKEGWALKNWCFQILVLEKTLESLLDSKEIKAVNPKENQLWICIGRTDADAPTLWQPDVKSQFTGKVPDPGKDWEQEEKGVTENEMFGWHHWLNGYEFEECSNSWIWANSARQWSTGKPGMLQNMGSWRVRHDLGAERQHEE